NAAQWTGDGKWLVVATKQPAVLLCPADGKQPVKLDLPLDHFPRSIAVHPKTGKLAVGVGAALPAVLGKPRFFMEPNDEIWVYSDPFAENPKPRKIKHSGRVEALAFHPTDDRLAVAGGDSDEVTLLDMECPCAPLSVTRGVGRRLYAVNLAENGEVIGVKTTRDKAATDPN